MDRFIGESTEPDSLKVLTPEEIESIFTAISYEESEKYPVETDANGMNVVFWLEGGAVWHVSRACSTIEKADPSKVNSGMVRDAMKSGKERPCKICGKDAEYPESLGTDTPDDSSGIEAESISAVETEKYPKEYGEDGELVVFWVESGKVWHESRHCSSLSRSDPAKILHGSVTDAVASGKERVCKNCS